MLGLFSPLTGLFLVLLCVGGWGSCLTLFILFKVVKRQRDALYRLLQQIKLAVDQADADTARALAEDGYQAAREVLEK